jgi:hypothetical protein
MSLFSQFDPRCWVSIWSDAELSGEADDLATALTGQGAAEHILALRSS